MLHHELLSRRHQSICSCDCSLSIRGLPCLLSAWLNVVHMLCCVGAGNRYKHVWPGHLHDPAWQWEPSLVLHSNDHACNTPASEGKPACSSETECKHEGWMAYIFMLKHINERLPIPIFGGLHHPWSCIRRCCQRLQNTCKKALA